MPPPVDLTGRRFGSLTVLGRGAPQLSASGKKKYPTWLTQCDCGSPPELYRAHRIPSTASSAARSDAVTACINCRSARRCEVCARTFVSLQFRACCGDECDVLHRRQIDLDCYHRRASDPAWRKGIFDARRQRERENEASAELAKAAEARRLLRRSERLKADPAYREDINSAARARYSGQAETHQARKRAARDRRIAAMTDIERDAYLERLREYSRKAAARYRSTPEGAEKNRANQRAAKAKAELARITQIGAEIASRAEKENDGHN